MMQYRWLRQGPGGARIGRIQAGGCFPWAVGVATLAVALAAPSGGAGAEPGVGSWPQWGGSSARNSVSRTTGLPAEWDVGQFDFRTGQWDRRSAKNIRWVASLGSESYGSPVVARGKVFCATNNRAGYVKRYPRDVDLGCLLAFDQADGRFLWQHSAEKLHTDLDHPEQGMCSTPLVEGDRLWIVTNRAEVVCLDTEGFTDGENDGPCTSEPVTGENESDVIWSFDMMAELGSVQHDMASCSVTALGDLLLVNTSNGVAADHETIPAPEAPSFVALDKRTGKLIWSDNSPGRNILHGQWGSPAAAVLGGVPQAIFPGGDGWLYSFQAQPAPDGRPRLLWRFDCNPKRSVWKQAGRGDRNNLIATPVIWRGRVYIATGQDPESGEGPGDLWGIDPNGRGDTSAERVVDQAGRPVPPRRITAVQPEAGETVVPNPHSAALWHYRGQDRDGDGERAFEETMHRAMGSVAIQENLLVIGDFAGLVHCLDARTGQVHWTYDMLAAIWGSPLIADGKIFIGDEDGEMAVFALSPKFDLLAENDMGDSVYSTPTAVDGVLYISTRSRLLAIAADTGR